MQRHKFLQAKLLFTEGSMKRQKTIFLFIILAVSLIVFTVSGCSKTDDAANTDSAYQQLYDKSCAAKEYADKQIDAFLQKTNSDYAVKETACSFVTNEEPYYIVCYKCNDGINDLFYGYKISVDENKNSTVIKEGNDIGRALFE